MNIIDENKNVVKLVDTIHNQRKIEKKNNIYISDNTDICINVIILIVRISKCIFVFFIFSKAEWKLNYSIFLTNMKYFLQNLISFS